jgi:hypothetical protein
MAQFSVEINDADVSRVLDAIAVNYNRPETVSNPSFDSSLPESESNSRTIDNPESKAAFANRIVREFLAEHVYSYEQRLAIQAVESPADITITDPQE